MVETSCCDFIFKMYKNEKIYDTNHIFSSPKNSSSISIRQKYKTMSYYNQKQDKINEHCKETNWFIIGYSQTTKYYYSPNDKRKFYVRYTCYGADDIEPIFIEYRKKQRNDGLVKEK